jgi:hypothetical protein
MEQKTILTLFVVGFCVIFLGSIFYMLGQTVPRHTEMDYSYRGVNSFIKCTVFLTAL